MSRSDRELEMMEIGEDAGRRLEAEAILAEWESRAVCEPNHFRPQHEQWVMDPEEQREFGKWLRARVTELRKGASE